MEAGNLIRQIPLALLPVRRIPLARFTQERAFTRASAAAAPILALGRAIAAVPERSA